MKGRMFSVLRKGKKVAYKHNAYIAYHVIEINMAKNEACWRPFCVAVNLMKIADRNGDREYEG